MKLVKLSSIFAIFFLNACIGSSVNNEIDPNSTAAVQSKRTFPTVNVSDLDGKEYLLPNNFEKNLNLVVVGFAHEQKEAIKTWMSELSEILKQFPQVGLYKIPVIDPSNAALRTVIRNGMRSKADELTRKQTLTLFIDRHSFADVIGVKDISVPTVLMTSSDGSLLWIESGTIDSAKIENLKSALTLNK